FGARRRIYRSAGAPHAARLAVEWADPDDFHYRAGVHSGALDVDGTTDANGEMAAHSADGAGARASHSATRRNFRSASSRSDTPGAGFERSAGDRGRRGAIARFARVAVDRGASARELKQQAEK